MKETSSLIAIIVSAILKILSIGFILSGVRIFLILVSLNRRLQALKFEKFQMLVDGGCFVMFGVSTFFIARKILKEASRA